MLKKVHYFFYIFFFLKSLSLYCQPVYTIPFASVQPKFVFPIYFEESGGQKDTLYLGYDNSASGLGVSNTFDDSSFGVKRVFVDTNLFYVCWADELRKSFNPPILNDSVYKSNVSPLNGSMGGPQFPGIYDIRMNNGVLPLKISWDRTLFYSDSLPFISNPPTPIGQGRFIISFTNDEFESENGSIICQFWPYIILTDTTVNSICTAKDSLTIFNIQSQSIPVKYGIFTFHISAWSGVNTGIDNSMNETIEAYIYPNPFSENFTVRINGANNIYSIRIVDCLGKLVYNTNSISEETKMFTGNLKQGIYIIELKNNNKIFREKIVKK